MPTMRRRWRNVDLDGREEAVGLAADAELPIEELLARYGHATSADVHEHPKGPEGKEVVAEDDEEGDAFAGAMRAMEDVQPTGNTLATATVKTQVPFLLKGQLREYQLIGLDWLVTLYHRRLNGILADEMGLGKTIQTIALLAWLAAERGDWGPHLVVVPTSVMLNWEMEFKRWCPAFKLLTYFGSPKDRAAKRQGWSKPNAFHVCITSYTMILQDARMFRRKKWKYLILDEAHMIKNWKSQRWQTLLNFNSKRRLLITGTPLQNDLMELWSLMHFLMPQVFASHAQFKDWFSNPLTGMVEGSAEYNKAVVERLHTVLRPFLLRRLKKDVEKQLPAKHEHVVWCKLSKRQRLLYEEYMASRDTRATLASGNYLGIMNCLMQLRKVCNHPDLFEGRPIVSAFDAQPFEWRVPSAVLYGLDYGGSQQLPQELLLPGNSLGWAVDGMSGAADRSEAYRLSCRCDGSNMNISINACTNSDKEPSLLSSLRRTPSQHALSILTACFSTVIAKRNQRREQNIARIEALSRSRLTAQASVWLTTADCLRLRMCGMGGSRATADLVKLDLVKLPAQRAEEAGDLVKSFAFVIPRARVQGPPSVWCFHPDPSAVVRAADRCRRLQQLYEETGAILHAPILRSRLFFPDKRLIQYDCGKLQELAVLLGRLRSGGHRALIFTQMSRMLDVLESFLNLHAYTYVRLDGSTKPEMRQMLMQRFNTDPKIFCFILSTRSGGVGMNLTGADTVIFYDSDWNPAMDAQAQDRCHRIGQTREVNIYRLVSQHTIEENILRKSDQKRHLDWLAIQSGGFTTEAFFETPGEDRGEVEAAMRAAEDEGDRNAAAAAEKELAAEMDEFADGGVQTASELYIRGDKQSRSSGRGDGDGEDDNEEENEKEEENENEKSKSAQTDQKIETESQEKPSPITDEGFEDMAALATAGGQNSVASLETLQAALSPVERYAVRFVEEDKEGTGAAAALDPSAIEAMAAAMEATYKVEELDVDAIEAAEEEREAEIDEDEEVNVAVDWDQDGASAAYVKQLEAAEAEEREREAAWSTYYAAYAVADADANANANANVYVAEAGKTVDGMGDGGHRAVGEVPARGKRGRRSVISNSNNRTTTTISGEDVNLPVHEYEDNGNDDLKNVNRDVEFWRPNEDFVLCMIVSMLLQQGDTPSSLWWGIVSDALAAGAAATTVLSGRPAMMPTRFSPVSCQQRYEQLVAAYNFSRNQEAVVDSLCTTGLWDEVKQVLMHHCDHEALASMYHVLSRSDGDGDRQLLSMLHGLRAIEGQGIVKPNHILPPETVPEVEVVDRILSAVRAECGAGSARVIASRLPATIQAAKSQLVLPVFLGP
jgi:SNF2 family DNA or RNA helicase